MFLNKACINIYQKVLRELEFNVEAEGDGAEVNSLAKPYCGKFNKRKYHGKHQGGKKKQLKCYLCGSTDNRVARCPQLKTVVEAFQATKSAYINVLTDDL
ncbi:hypothetical protein HII13_001250 [Brettanomyces bruxellensis]|nr:hypothetical protein HII13_001250 [Brettanomyces bruxellensis]